jgi:hypothetical protein
MRTITLIWIGLLALLFTLTACGDALPTPTVTPAPQSTFTRTLPQPTPAATATSTTQTGATPMASVATVESVEAQAQAANPNLIDVVISGYLPNPCTEIAQVDQERNGNTFTITLATTQKPGACVQVISPFEQTVTIDATGLAPGTYSVDVQNMSATFELK